MDIKSASKAHDTEIIFEEKPLVTQYNESSMVVTVHPDKRQASVVSHTPGPQSSKSRVISPDGLLNEASSESKSASNKSLVHCQSPPSENYSGYNRFDEGADKPLGMLIRGFPTRSTDSSIRDGLYHDYKKYGKVLSVNVVGQGDERHAIVSFKKSEDAAKALEASHDKKFFGSRLQVYPHEGLEVKAEFRQQDDQDEYHHKATRTLFVGNLDKSTTKEFLRDVFLKYGNIIDVDIKNQGQATCYAFIQFDNIKSVVQALREMDDEHINNNKVKVGFGKSMPTTCVWLEGIAETVSEKYLALQHLSCFGHIVAVYIDRKSTRALVFYDNVEQAIVAVNELRGRVINDRRIQVDFASRDCQNMFLDAMEQSNQLRLGDRPEDRINRTVHPINGCEYVRQWSYDQAQPRNRFFPFDGLSPSRGSYSNRAGFFPPRSSGSRLAIPAFYDNFEQRREGCLGIRSSFKTSYEQLYDKEPVLLGRSGKERSLSLERQRSSFRGIPPDSPLSREEDIGMSLKYTEEWDLSDDKKVERKRSRRSRDSGSLIVTAHDSKGSLSKKKDQSPSYLAGLPPPHFKKQHKGSRSSRSNIDVYNSQAWLHSRSDENSTDATSFVDAEKGKANVGSPHKRRKSKYRGDPEGGPNHSNSTVRRSKRMSDDSSSCSSSYSSSSISCVSLNSDSGGETASKSSEEVLALEQEKEKLLKLLKDMEDKDCYESDGVAVIIEDGETKEKTLKKHIVSSVGDCNDKSNQKSRSKSDECFEPGMVNFKRKVSVTSDGDHKEDVDDECSIRVVIEGNPQPGNRTRPSKKQLAAEKVSRRRNTLDRGNKDSASHVTISDDSESCKEKFFSSCHSPSSHERLRRHSVLDAEEAKDPLNTSLTDRNVVAGDGTYKNIELIPGDQLSAHDNSANAVVESDAIQNNEPVSLAVGEAGPMPIEPRSSDTMTRVREVMCLPLPRFAFDLPGLRKKSQPTPMSETTNESKPDTSFHQSPNQAPDLSQAKKNDGPNLVPQLLKSLSDDFTNVEPETTQSSECPQVVESSSSKPVCKDEEKDVDMLDASLNASEKVVSKSESDEVDQVCKENSDVTSSRSNEQACTASNPAQAVVKADDESCKSDRLDVKISCMGTEFISSVLDDLKAETGEQNAEDDELTNSLEERIRVLDEKLSKIQQGVSKLPPTSAIAHSETAASGPVATLDYREKYKRHRKEHAPSAVTPSYEQKSEPSDLAKILLSRSSIFDQDTQRLEMLNQITQQNDSTFISDVPSFSHLNQGLGNIRVCSLAAGQQPGHVNMPDQTNLLVKGPNQSVPGPLKSNSFTKLPDVSPYPNYNFTPSSLKFPDTNTKYSSDLLSSRSIVQPGLAQTSMSHSSSTGDPRRMAKPLDHSSIPSRRNIPGAIFPDVVVHGDIISSELHPVPLVTSIPSAPVFKSKEMVSPPVSILKKHGLSTEDASFLHSAETESVSSNPLKRRSDVAFGDKDLVAKHGGKVMKLENKVEGNISKIASPKQPGHLATASSTSKVVQKSASVKTVVGSAKTTMSQSPTLKNKVGTSLNKSSSGEKKDDKKVSNENTSKSDEGVASQSCAKKEQEASEKVLKSHGDVKVKETEEKVHQKGDKKDHKPSLVKRLSAETKDEAEKKIKQTGKEVSSSSSTTDNNALKKDLKKEDHKTTSLVNNKVVKMSNKPKGLPDISSKKKEGVITKDPKLNIGKTFDKSLVNKPKIVSFKPNTDEHKEQKPSLKHSDGTKDPREDRKHSKLKLASVSGSSKGGPAEAMKKSANKVQMLHPTISSKDKKPAEEKREVKALLQELGSGEDMNTQYFSMYDMVKRRSCKGSGTPKSIEGRSKSLSQLKATSKQKQSRKNSFRLSSNDSDSNADTGSAKLRGTQTSRPKTTSKSSSSDTSPDSSSSGEEENEVEKTESKIVKKSYKKLKASFNKRRNVKDNSRAGHDHSTNSSSSSDNSDNEAATAVKSKKVLGGDKARSASKKQANRSCNIYTSSEDERNKRKTFSDSTSGNIEPLAVENQPTNKTSASKTPPTGELFAPKNNELMISSCSAKLSLSFSSSSSSDEYIASQIRDIQSEVCLFEEGERIDDAVQVKLEASNVEPVKSYVASSSEKPNFETVKSSGEISSSELPQYRTLDLKADNKEWIVSDFQAKKEPSNTESVDEKNKQKFSATGGESSDSISKKSSKSKLEKAEKIEERDSKGPVNDNKNVNIFEKLSKDCFTVSDSDKMVIDHTDDSNIAVSSLPAIKSEMASHEKIADSDKTVPAPVETDLLHSQLADNLKENSSKQETIVEAVKTISNSESEESIPVQQILSTESNSTGIVIEQQGIDDNDFDDADAENNTEELDMAIKSLMCDNEDQVQVAPVHDVSPAILSDQQKPKVESILASSVGSSSGDVGVKVEEEKNNSLKSVRSAEECFDESGNKGKVISDGSGGEGGSDVLRSFSNESEGVKSDKENQKIKASDSAGHFICTFKPEFADCQERSVMEDDKMELSSENAFTADERSSVPDEEDQKDVSGFSKKRSCENVEDSVAKKVKLDSDLIRDLASPRGIEPCKTAVQGHTNEPQTYENFLTSDYEAKLSSLAQRRRAMMLESQICSTSTTCSSNTELSVTESTSPHRFSGTPSSYSSSNILGAGSSVNTLGASSSVNMLGASSSVNMLGGLNMGGISSGSSLSSMLGASSSSGVPGASSLTGVPGASFLSGVLGASSSVNMLGALNMGGFISGMSSSTGLDAPASSSMLAASSSLNTLAASSSLNTLGASSSLNMLGASSSLNTLGASSSLNTLAASSSFNTLGASSSFNTLAASSSLNTLGAVNMGVISSEAVPSLEMGNNISSSNELASKPSWQTNMDRVIEDVAKGNFERGFEPDFYSLQRKHKTKSKEDMFSQSSAGTPLSQLSSTFTNSPIPSIIVPLSQSGHQGLPVSLSPQTQQQQHGHRYSFGQTVPQNNPVTPSQLQYPNGSSQSQSVTIMTGSGLIQVSGANIPSLQQLQMYTAGVAAAHQFQQQNFLSPDILSQQQRIIRPSVDAATTNLRPSSCYQNEQLPSPVPVINNLASKPTAKTYQLTGVHVHQNIPCSPVSDHPTLQTSSQMDICNVGNGCPRWNAPFGPTEEFNQRMAGSVNMNMIPSQNKERAAPSTSHQRMFSSDNNNTNCSTLSSTSISQQQNPSIGHPNPQIHHSYHLNQQQPYQQTGSVNSPSSQVHQIISSSNNSSMGHPESLSFSGFSQSPANRHFQFDQSNFMTLEGNQRPQGNLSGFTQKQFVGVSQNVGTAVAISLPSVPNQSQLTKSIDSLHGTLRPASQKIDCRQQLFIRPIVAMQQQVQATTASSSLEQHATTPSPILVGQHRMPFAIKEPRFSSNPPRAEPKTPGGTSQQSPMMVGIVGSVGQQLQHHPVQNSDSSSSQPSVNLFSGLTSPPVGLLGSAVLIPQQQQQLALEKSLLINATAQQQQQQQQRFVQPATVFQYAAPAQQVSLHHLSNTSQLEFFVGGKRMVAPIIQALSTDSIMNHSHPSQANQGIHLPAHLQSSLVQQGRPSPESFDRGLSNLSQRLPVVWQGMLALKNDSAHVQMHYVSGSKTLVQASLPDNVAPLRIAQRMRLEQTQLEQVTKRMNESDFSMLLAVPCGRDPVEIMTQSHNLQTFFIHYLQQKQAAGIVNILQPNSTQTAYVVHIFPPCEFSASNLGRLPSDIVQNLVEGGYLLIIITTC